MIFLTLLANGLASNPQAAMDATLAAIGPATDAGPVRMTCVFSDGTQLHAYRYASDRQCPTLYLSGKLDNGGVALASEPLDGDTTRWTQVPVNQLVTVPVPLANAA